MAFEILKMCNLTFCDLDVRWLIARSNKQTKDRYLVILIDCWGYYNTLIQK